jgi:hypothetical protein
MMVLVADYREEAGSPGRSENEMGSEDQKHAFCDVWNRYAGARVIQEAELKQAQGSPPGP